MPKPMSQERKEQIEASRFRAENGHALTNYPVILAEFAMKGIPMDQIIPRVNVFTYAVWQSKGRQVRKGEKGVKIATWRPVTRKDKGGQVVVSEGTGEPSVRLLCTGATVFHISQTDPIAN